MVCRYFQFKHFFITTYLNTRWQPSCELSTLRNMVDRKKDRHTTALHWVSKSLSIYLLQCTLHYVYIVVSSIFPAFQLTMAIYSTEKILCAGIIFHSWYSLHIEQSSLSPPLSQPSQWPNMIDMSARKTVVHKSIPLAALFSWGVIFLWKELSGKKWGLSHRGHLAFPVWIDG